MLSWIFLMFNRTQMVLIIRDGLQICKLTKILQNEETSEIVKNFVGSKATWPLTKVGIYPIKNIGLEILRYMQIFTLVKATFFLEGIQLLGFIINETSKWNTVMEEIFQVRQVFWWNYRLFSQNTSSRCLTGYYIRFPEVKFHYLLSMIHRHW